MNRIRVAAPILSAVIFSALAAAPLSSQAQPSGAPSRPALLTAQWKASWITAPGASAEGFGVLHFRRTIDLSARPASYIVHLSGDNRYRFFVNGTPVASGPARGDLMHWSFESVDLAPYLKTGRNVLAAMVWNFGELKPVAQISYRTGFIVQGDGEREAAANTGTEWRALRDTAYTGIRVTAGDVDGYFAAAPGEEIDASRYPWGWESPSYDDAGWAQAVSVRPGRPRGIQPYGEADGWQLVPRTIPPMEETEQRLAAVRRVEGGAGAGAGFLAGTSDLVIPARSTRTLLLDQGFETNAYTTIETSGGSGATLKLTYAEALRDAQGVKGNRNEIEGKTIKGYHDLFHLDGGAHRVFRTLSFRTFRYIQLEVSTADEPVRIHDLHGVFTGYPFQERARFSSDQPWLRDVWEIGWRTARLDAVETYFDCPYFEQLQYAGDTRIQALISLYMSGDDQLVRQALVSFDRSRIPEGITASRYPSNLRQLIPPFSLVWVGMVHDYWMHRDDPAFVRTFLPGIHSVLSWYEQRLRPDGLPGASPWWNFVDWAYTHPPFVRGVPPGGDEGGSTLIALQYLAALQNAAQLADSLGATDDAAHYRSVARRVSDGVTRETWDAGRGLFAESPERKVFSQHTNSLAVLTGVAPAAMRGEIMRKVVSDSSLVQAGYYFQFYVNEALARAGEGDRYLAQLAPWRGMLALGLTTVPETPEPTRSDSHAWSAHPNYGMLSIILGVRPASPGFHTVRIAPALGPLQHAEGRVPHPLGDIDVALERVGGEGIRARITLPAGLTGTFAWRGREVALRGGAQVVEFAATAGSPLRPDQPIRGWTLLSNSEQDDLAVIAAAREYDINHVQLSHEIVMDLRDVKEEKVRGLVNRLTEAAHAAGIQEVVAWDHALYELKYYPERFRSGPGGTIDLDNPEFWAWFKQDYRDMLDRVPHVNGLVLTFIETGARAENQYSRRLTTPQEKLAAVVNAVADVVIGERHMNLYARTFAYTQTEYDNITRAVERFDRPEIRLMMKETPHDFFLTHPNDFYAGKLPNLTLVEFDAAGEFNGQGLIASTWPEYILRRWSDLSKRPHVAGYVARTDRYGATRLIGRPSEIDLYALKRYSEDPTLTADRIYDEFITRRYGSAALPHVKKAFQNAYDIVTSTLYTLGTNIANHSSLDYDPYSSSYARHVSGKWIDPPVAHVAHRVNRDLNYWSDVVDHLAPPAIKAPAGAQWSEVPWVSEQRLIHPDERMDETFLRYVITEKDFGVAKAEESLREIELARGALKSADYADLHAYFERTLLTARLYRAVSAAYFGYRVYARGDGFRSDYVMASTRDGLRAIPGLAREIREYPVKPAAGGQWSWVEDADQAMEYYDRITHTGWPANTRGIANPYGGVVFPLD